MRVHYDIVSPFVCLKCLQQKGKKYVSMINILYTIFFCVLVIIFFRLLLRTRLPGSK